MLGGCLSSCQLGDEFNLEYTWLGIIDYQTVIYGKLTWNVTVNVAKVGQGLRMLTTVLIIRCAPMNNNSERQLYVHNCLQ